MSEEKPPLVIGPSTIMSPESFADWMSYTVSSEFLTPERLAFLGKMSENLARDPNLLKLVERMLADYGDDFKRISPSQAELESTSAKFRWTGQEPGTVAIAPVAAAAALAPPAAAMAAAHTPAD